MGLQKPAEEIISEGTLGADEEVTTDTVDLTRSSHFTVTVEVDFDPEADAGLTCHLRSSPDKSNWDTQDVGAKESGNWNTPYEFASADHAGTTVQHTVPIEEVFKYMRVQVENNATIAATNLAVTATRQEVEPY